MPSASPCPDSFNLAAYVPAAGEASDKPALEVWGASPDIWSYARLTAAVRGAATGLLAQGLQPGARILLRLGNEPAFPIAFLGAIAAGLIPVPTSPQLTVSEISKLAGSLRPDLVVAGPGIALPEGHIPTISQETLSGFASLPPAEFAMGDPNRPAYIIYTSGTSGQQRAVVHAHRAIWARRMMWDGWYGLRPSDRLLHAGAFNWTYTLGTGLMDPWAIGATALIPAPGTESSALPGLLDEARATIFAAAPGVYRQMLRHPIPALPHLRHGLSAGEKLGGHLRQAWQEATGTQIHEAFGMSECSTFLSGSPDRPAPDMSLGFAQPGRRVALLNDAGPAAIGSPGTIAIHRDDPGLMLGYLDQPAETAAKYQGKWFLTGDIGVMDASGAITYQGRADDMMNAGGFRVSPIEVEAALSLHPGIRDVAACEVRVGPDTTVIAAFWTGPDALDDAELAAFAGERLARYKTPRLWVRLDGLPRGANNKLLRRQLRTDWETAHGQT
ncbi:class I adenylate-forming enzyme family protein [Flavimaricola marinus]|uniref:Long-chain-fatty-acid--CoA ligase n=1 Tax=Flavimaricola marinus TaxID=1819565 RepID=A0A238LEV8_9RHOB|nr:class I adenylate-forming enzyme family protein [Flavimaricola marinus]SMY07450.1 Long-chain-fatty-acid--CoA ligase [Flavimaricola marinus]